jgi:hypothetical protein
VDIATSPQPIFSSFQEAYTARLMPTTGELP